MNLFKRGLAVLASLAMCSAVVVQPYDNILSTTAYERTTVNYEWIVEPTIEADDIIVVDTDETCINQTIIDNMCKGFNSGSGGYNVYTSAAFRIGGTVGLMDYSGNILETNEKHNMFYIQNGKISVGYFWQSGWPGDRGRYYEYDEAKGTVKNSYSNVSPGNETVLVGKRDEQQNWYYGLFKKDSLIKPMIYENGKMNFASNNEITALFKDGKWGYFDADGNMIIDFICDSVNYFPWNIPDGILGLQVTGFGIDAEGNGIKELESEFLPYKNDIYMASDGYIPVKIDGKCGYYNTKGEEVIKTGTFAEVRPVHNGKAWVKDNGTGLWGVIEIKESAEVAEISDAEKYAQVVVNNFDLYQNSLYNNCDLSARSVDVCFFDIDLDGDLEFLTFLRAARNKTSMNVYDVDVSKNLLTTKGHTYFFDYSDVFDSDYDVDIYMDNNNEIFYVGTDLQELGEMSYEYPFDVIDKTCEITEKAFKFDGNELVTKNLFKISCKDESAIGQNEGDKFYYFADDDTPVEVSFEEYNSRVEDYYSNLTNLNLEYKLLSTLKEFPDYYWSEEEDRYVRLTDEERKEVLIESYNAFRYDVPDIPPETTTTTTTTETTTTTTTTTTTAETTTVTTTAETTTTTATTTESTVPFNPTQSGTCGENAVWEYDEESKTLVISGESDIEDYSSNRDVPWSDLFTDIKKVVIEKGITRISNYAFEGLYYLETIDIPDTVKSIGYRAFAGCWRLKSVNIPYGVETIGEEAFSSCRNLVDLNISNSVKKIQKEAFRGCRLLETVYLPNSVSDIGTYAFYSCESLASVTIANPDCDIYADTSISTTAKIYGHENSTAQAFAEKYGRGFVVLDSGETISGDVDVNGRVDASDASAILVEYAILSTGGDSTFTDEQRKAADVDDNGMVDASDASVILAFYSYLSTGGRISNIKVWLETQ